MSIVAVSVERTAILSVLLRVGIDGADDSRLEDELGVDFAVFDGELQTLVADGRVESVGCSWYRLPIDDWAMRAAELARERTTIDAAEAIASLLRGEQ